MKTQEEIEALSDDHLTRFAANMENSINLRKKQVDSAIADGTICDKFYLANYLSDSAKAFADACAEIGIRRHNKKS